LALLVQHSPIDPTYPEVIGALDPPLSSSSKGPSLSTNALGFGLESRDNWCSVPEGIPIMVLTAVLIPAAEGGFTALNPETGTTTQGESVEEAVANLREATELYLEEFPLKMSGQALVTTFQVTVNA
jgi:predicted RNase H-like HicB family nuclease